MLNDENINPAKLSNLIEKEIIKFDFKNSFKEIGRVISVSDGIIIASGLDNVFYGELVFFTTQNLYGIVLNLEKYCVGIILLGDFSKICEGDEIQRTRNFLSIKVSHKLLGRVIDALGNPIDNQGSVLEGSYYFRMPIERKAPEVIFREPVCQPLHTGIKIIDAMIPIGLGQRELIIGDRQTGKTSIAIDTILNQKKLYRTNQPVYCIYVSIGQKLSSLAQVLDVLAKFNALDYTIIVSASASSSASMQFLAPFSATAIGEYFRDLGHNALIIYDDLSKHAIAYREISLLLQRSPGREAYPGDVFYLHSRLLERSAKIISDINIAKSMNDVPIRLKPHIQGGGSLTSFPIVETQAGDISSYIPTNVISITDGQIFLESSLFNSGIKPAINERLSVSRVGGMAQTRIMRQVSNKLKLDQAQYKDLESFSQLSSDLDQNTVSIITRGQRNIELLKQDLHNVYDISIQIAIIFIANSNILNKIPINKVHVFEKKFVNILQIKYIELLNNISSGLFNDSVKNILNQVASDIVFKLI